MFHVKHEQQFEKRHGLYQFHPMYTQFHPIKIAPTQPSKMAQPSHFQPITPLIILLLFTLIKHHLFAINLSTTTNSCLSTLNINFLLYITKFISLSTSLLLINYYVQQGRGGQINQTALNQSNATSSKPSKIAISNHFLPIN